MLPRLVIFDMDGLIFNTERLFMSKIHIYLKEYGYPALESNYVQTIGLAGVQLHEKLLRLYGPDYPEAEISAKARAATDLHMETYGPEVKPGIESLLQWLSQKQIPCCVASSTHHEIVEKYLKLAHLDTYFSHIIGGDEVRISKPAPDIFLAACAHFDVQPEHALVLEDSENGVRAAFNGNIPVICIPDIKQPCAEIQKKSCAVLASAHDVIDFLHSI